MEDKLGTSCIGGNYGLGSSNRDFHRRLYEPIKAGAPFTIAVALQRASGWTLIQAKSFLLHSAGLLSSQLLVTATLFIINLPQLSSNQSAEALNEANPITFNSTWVEGTKWGLRTAYNKQHEELTGENTRRIWLCVKNRAAGAIKANKVHRARGNGRMVNGIT